MLDSFPPSIRCSRSPLTASRRECDVLPSRGLSRAGPRPSSALSAPPVALPPDLPQFVTMTTTAVSPPHTRALSDTRAHPITPPLAAVLFSSACIVIGLLWDISWHKTVGRDTFWTLPHLPEQLGPLRAGLRCGRRVRLGTREHGGGAGGAQAPGLDWTPRGASGLGGKLPAGGDRAARLVARLDCRRVSRPPDPVRR